MNTQDLKAKISNLEAYIADMRNSTMPEPIKQVQIEITEQQIEAIKKMLNEI